MQTLTAVGAVAAVIGAIPTIEKYALRIVRIAKRFTGEMPGAGPSPTIPGTSADAN